MRGVEHVDPATATAMAGESDCFTLAAWNAHYYGLTRVGDQDREYIDALLQKQGPSEHDKREARSWRRLAARWAYSLADHIPVLISLIRDAAVRNAISETLRYFENHDNIGREVRDLFKSLLKPMLADNDRVLLIAHSMGSVIAYDALWELWHEDESRTPIELFLTLGSPLGMRYVQRRLVGFRDGRRYPGNIQRWVNVATEGDLTALDAKLADDFHEMVDRGWTESITDRHEGVFGYFRNQAGLNVHRSYGYLVHPVVGETIAAWWRDGQARALPRNADIGTEA